MNKTWFIAFAVFINAQCACADLPNSSLANFFPASRSGDNFRQKISSDTQFDFGKTSIWGDTSLLDDSGDPTIPSEPEEDPGLGGATPGTGIGNPSGDANVDDIENARCPNTELLSGKLISNTCWTCIFPVISMGVPLGADKDEAPEDRYKEFFCMCKDNLGVPYPGFSYGLWMPSKSVEFVREPGCLMTLNGASLGFSKTMQGTWSEQKKDTDSPSFAHYHYYSFPLLVVLDMFDKVECIKDHYLDIDILFFSEVDPTWNDDTISYFTSPEAALLANPVALTACIPDAVSSTHLQRPISSLFWCAGSWGPIYPLTANTLISLGGVQDSSLYTARMLTALHRRGILKTTYGEQALCKPQYSATIPKSQYKISMIYPVPEKRSAHVIGESTLFWGSNRSVPVTGEDYVYLIWTWNDCCMSVFPGNSN